MLRVARGILSARLDRWRNTRIVFLGKIILTHAVSPASSQITSAITEFPLA